MAESSNKIEPISNEQIFVEESSFKQEARTKPE